MVRTNMAAMAHVFLAHRVRSIHTEKDTNLLENICDKHYLNDQFKSFLSVLYDKYKQTLSRISFVVNYQTYGKSYQSYPAHHASILIKSC